MDHKRISSSSVFKFDKNNFKYWTISKKWSTTNTPLGLELPKKTKFSNSTKEMVAVRKYYGMLCMLVQWSLYMTRQIFTIAILGEFSYLIWPMWTKFYGFCQSFLNLIERYGKTKRYGESKRRNIKSKCHWVYMWSCVRNGLASWFFQVMLGYQNICDFVSPISQFGASGGRFWIYNCIGWHDEWNSKHGTTW